MAGLLAARITPELRSLRRRSGAERASLDRAVGVRLIAAMVAGPIVSLWGAMVGMVVGWQVGQTLLGVSTHNFYLMFWDLLWFRDVVGLLFQGLAFGAATGIFACAEGLRGAADAGLPEVSGAACRAASIAALAILVINSGWFILVYHAGPAFGPTLLAPPGL
jgi:phospholipid/cholesterol/gamma-HCH transport system permease protein